MFKTRAILLFLNLFLWLNIGAVKAETEEIATYVVKDIEINGNTILDEPLEEIATQYENRTLSEVEIDELLQEINQLYRERGYETSGAYLEFDFYTVDKELKVNVVEGWVEEVVISGDYNNSYVKNALALNEPLDVSALLESLQLLRLNPQVRSVEAKLIPGTKLGSNILSLEVLAEDSTSLTLATDNRVNSPAISSFRRGLQFEQNNLLGRADRFSFNYYNSSGSNSFNAAYLVPYAQGSSFYLYGDYANNDVVEEPFEEFDIELEGLKLGIGIDRGVYVTANKRLGLGVEFSYHDSDALVLGEPFGLSRGADDSGNLTVSSLRFFQNYTSRTEKSIFQLSSGFNFGLDIFDSTVAADGIDGIYFSWTGDGQYIRSFTPGGLISSRISLQLSPDTLPGLEQFRMGGYRTVRGYREGVSSADGGLNLSSEVQLPVYYRGNRLVAFTPFVDAAMVWSNDGVEQRVDSLLGMGLGLKLQLGTLEARLDYGIPLLEVDSTGDSLQESGLYFSLTNQL